MAEEPIIYCKNIHKWYDDFHALRGIDHLVLVNQPLFVPSIAWKNIRRVKLS